MDRPVKKWSSAPTCSPNSSETDHSVQLLLQNMKSVHRVYSRGIDTVHVLGCLQRKGVMRSSSSHSQSLSKKTVNYNRGPTRQVC